MRTSHNEFDTPATTDEVAVRLDQIQYKTQEGPCIDAPRAGTALTAFSGGLLGLYLRTPGMHEEGSVRLTQQGMPLAKDVCLAGIGASLTLDGVLGWYSRT